MISTSANIARYLTVLLIVARGIECSVSKNLEPEEPIRQVCRNISHGAVWRGSGVQTTYQPYLIYQNISSETIKLYNLTLFTVQSTRPCNFTLKFESFLWRLSPYQVSVHIIYILITIAYSGHRGPLVIVDMSTCLTRYVGESIGDAKSNYNNNWIYHENNFEGIYENNGTILRQSYGYYGDKFGYPQPYLLPFHQRFDSIAVSRLQQHLSNVIVMYINNQTYFVRLVNADGYRIKDLLTFENWEKTLGTNFRYEFKDLVYTFCWSKNAFLHCAQFDDVGGLLYRNSTKNEILEEDRYAQIIAVHYLEKGGVAVVIQTAIQLRVIEMRPGEISVKTYMVRGKKISYGLVVTDYDETNGRLTVRMDPKDPDETEMCFYTLYNTTQVG